MRSNAPKSVKAKGLVVLRGVRQGVRPGSVWLVGAGPGDPELLTIKALKALQRADVVIHDGLVSDDVLALAPDSARRISVAKRKSRHSYAQDEINRMLAAFALDGLTVVRLKGGDPFIFGRGLLIVGEAMALAQASLPLVGRESDAEHRGVGKWEASAGAGALQPDFPTRPAARSFPPRRGEGS